MWFMLLGLACQAAGSGQEAKPNIVVFLVDDMGVMDTSVPFLCDSDGKPKRYPLNDFYPTPNMERLAARGTRFSRFSAMSVCSPSRVSLLTGQNSARHRVTNWIDPDGNNAGPLGPRDWNWSGLKPGQVSLAELLRRGGYQTIHVGKGHLAPRGKPGADPRDVGFEVNVGGDSFGSPGSYFGKDGFGLARGAKRNAVPGLEFYHGKDVHLTEALTEEAKKRVGAVVETGKPFFLHFSHYAVHAPFQADPRFVGHYRESGKPAQAQAFASLVEGMDKSLGDLLDHLEKLGVADNTLVLFLGDNGSDAPLGDHQEVACSAPLRGGKGSQYEGGTRVAFIAAWAKPNAGQGIQGKFPIVQGRSESGHAAVYDLFPTVLEVAGLRNPDGHVLDGKSLTRLMAGQADPGRDNTFLMHYPHAPHRTDYFTTYRDGDWKVIYHYFPGKASGGSHYQLFNLKDDPFEQRDLSTTRAEELKRLMRGMVARLAEQGADYPVARAGGKPVKPEIPE